MRNQDNNYKTALIHQIRMTLGKTRRIVASCFTSVIAHRGRIYAAHPYSSETKVFAYERHSESSPLLAWRQLTSIKHGFNNSRDCILTLSISSIELDCCCLTRDGDITRTHRLDSHHQRWRPLPQLDREQRLSNWLRRRMPLWLDSSVPDWAIIPLICGATAGLIAGVISGVIGGLTGRLVGGLTGRLLDWSYNTCST